MPPSNSQLALICEAPVRIRTLAGAFHLQPNTQRGQPCFWLHLRAAHLDRASPMLKSIIHAALNDMLVLSNCRRHRHAGKRSEPRPRERGVRGY
jgi:hypothetical protein